MDPESLGEDPAHGQRRPPWLPGTVNDELDPIGLHGQAPPGPAGLRPVADRPLERLPLLRAPGGDVACRRHPHLRPPARQRLDPAPVDHCVGDWVGIHAVEEGTRPGSRAGASGHPRALRTASEGWGGRRARPAARPWLPVHRPRAPGGDRPLGHRSLAEPRLVARAERCWREVLRSLEEQLRAETFDTVEGLEAAGPRPRERLNRSWLYERHGYRTLQQVRQELATALLEAA